MPGRRLGICSGTCGRTDEAGRAPPLRRCCRARLDRVQARRSPRRRMRPAGAGARPRTRRKRLSRRRRRCRHRLRGPRALRRRSAARLRPGSRRGAALAGCARPRARNEEGCAGRHPLERRAGGRRRAAGRSRGAGDSPDASGKDLARPAARGGEAALHDLRLADARLGATDLRRRHRTGAAPSWRRTSSRSVGSGPETRPATRAGRSTWLPSTAAPSG